VTDPETGIAGSDPHLLFDDHPPVDGVEDMAEVDAADEAGSGRHSTGGSREHFSVEHSRVARTRHARKTIWRRRGRLILALGAVLGLVIIAGAVGWARKTLSVKDYHGNGTTPVAVVVNTGDTASDIAATLYAAGVVESTKAFVKAAAANSDSQNIQPGTYTLRKHMSGAAAVALLLDPKSRNAASEVVVTEGATSLAVAARLATALHESPAAVRAAMDNVDQLGLPSTYNAIGGGPLTSVEGFLYPATYTVDPGVKTTDLLTQMIAKFVEQDRQTGFSVKSQAIKLTPYQALIIASIVQSEAKFPADMPKVARVILNRIKAQMPLQIDATSAYAAKLQGLDPTKVIYADIDSPYNTYKHDGLPPTPISNPGAEALSAATAPASGDWLYYVNSDAAGHLFFTNSDAEFEAAAQKCKDNNWGCG
jgi:UPF0755 protein